MQTYINAHRNEDAQPFDDVAMFLPFPGTWKMQMHEHTLNVSRKTAIAVIQSMSWLDSNVLAAIDPWVAELEMLIAGD